ncbi:GNAT family N-acetyltransferase [Sphingomonas arantia]
MATIFASAFQDEPALSYIIPDPTERAVRLPSLFHLLIESDDKSGLQYMTEDGAAAALWRRPGQARLGWKEMLSQARPMVSALGPHLVRALRVSHAMEQRFPTTPFWYLHYVGCERSRQRSGLGAEVVRAGLAHVDGYPIYLETADPDNIPFYEQLGFSITSHWRTFPGGPSFWSLLSNDAVGRL